VDPLIHSPQSGPDFLFDFLPISISQNSGAVPISDSMCYAGFVARSSIGGFFGSSESLPCFRACT